MRLVLLILLLAGVAARAGTLLVLTEPTARGYCGPVLDEWAREVNREGLFSVVIRELPRWTGSWATNDWPGLNRMSNEVVRFQPSAVLIVGRLPRLKTGGHALDGHEMRCIITDAWLGCTNITFTDTDSWGMPGTVAGVSSAIGSNEPGDGIPDETSGTYARAVSRIDASGMTSAAGNFGSGYLIGQPYRPAIDEGEWLRRYFTNNIALRRGQWTTDNTGHINSSSWFNSADISAANTAVSWTSGSASGPAGGSYRFVYDSLELQDFSPNWITAGGTPLRALWTVNYKSYQMELPDGVGAYQRRLFPGVIDQPWAMVSGWCVGAFGADPYWVQASADATVADSIRTSAKTYSGGTEPPTCQWGFPIAGDLSLPVDSFTAGSTKVSVATSFTVQ